MSAKHARRSPRSSRAYPALALSVLAALSLVAAALSLSAAPRRPAPAVHAAAAPAPSTTTPTASPTTTSTAPAVPATTVLATLSGPTQAYASPGGAPSVLLPAQWLDSPSVLPVVATAGDWLDVRIAQRPNGQTGWIERSQATLSATPYAIVIDLSTEHLELFRDGEQVLDAPAGIGTATDPTPTGQFFLALFAEAPSPDYGPFVMVTSAHSDTITDWDESGDAIIAIHGPLGADAAIGTTGAAISHGCVRLHDSDLMVLRAVPDGSPIDIVS